MFKNIMELLKKIWENITDSSNSYMRWLILVSILFVLMLFAGFRIEEFKVTFLIIWYGIVATALSSVINYIYGKINYHKPDNDIAVIGQVVIFASTMLFTGLVLLGTYIAQFN